MSTVEDFENAPVGATATHLDGSRAVKMGDGEWGWITPASFYYDDEEMVYWSYTLDPIRPAPASAREALDLAWELAHPVKEGQVIPKGTRCLELSSSGPKGHTAQFDIKINHKRALTVCTLEPLPDPEPEWLDAPAVMARLKGFSYRRTWVSVEDGYWESIEEGHTHWRELTDVTPLYPKDKKHE